MMGSSDHVSDEALKLWPCKMQNFYGFSSSQYSRIIGRYANHCKVPTIQLSGATNDMLAQSYDLESHGKLYPIHSALRGF